MDDLLAEFVDETSESLGQLDLFLAKLEENPKDKELLAAIFRRFHTVKASCGFLNLSRMEKVAHHAENILTGLVNGNLEPTPACLALVHESARCMRDILNHIDENATEPAGDDISLIKKLDAASEGYHAEAAELHHATIITASPKNKSTASQPIATIWKKLPFIVENLCGKLGKDINLSMKGEDVAVPAGILELIKYPLMHIVRNACDHGIEKTQDRLAAGKTAAAQITLSARMEHNNLVLEIADDGKGLAHEKIRARIIQKKLPGAERAAVMPPEELQEYIFAPGFSTADSVTAISGRGVGMDVVRADIAQAGGSIAIKTTPGKGTAFIITIPLDF